MDVLMAQMASVALRGARSDHLDRDLACLLDEVGAAELNARLTAPSLIARNAVLVRHVVSRAQRFGWLAAH